MKVMMLSVDKYTDDVDESTIEVSKFNQHEIALAVSDGECDSLEKGFGTVSITENTISVMGEESMMVFIKPQEKLHTLQYHGEDNIIVCALPSTTTPNQILSIIKDNMLQNRDCTKDSVVTISPRHSENATIYDINIDGNDVEFCFSTTYTTLRNPA